MDQPFRFMSLPPELRELVYYHAMSPIKPIDTAAIPNTPDRVFIQPIAQLDKQSRNEALHVLFTSRPIEISLHSTENVRRALLWANKWEQHAGALPHLTISGRIAKLEFHFFVIDIEISDEKPYFKASARRYSSIRADKFISNMKREILAWLSAEMAGVSAGRERKLSGRALSDLVMMVDDLAKKNPVVEQV